MNFRSDSKPKEKQSTTDSSPQKRLIKIKRSSGKYEYVTRQQLEILNKKYRRREKAKKILKRTQRLLPFPIVGILILVASYLLYTRLTKATPLTAELVQTSKLPQLATEGNQAPGRGEKGNLPSGAVRVSCNLAGATIYLDGEIAGQTMKGDLLLTVLSAGAHKITVRHAGYLTVPESIDIEVDTSQTPVLKFTLTKVTGGMTSPITSRESSQSENSASPSTIWQRPSLAKPGKAVSSNTFQPIRSDTSPPTVTVLSELVEISNKDSMKFSWDANETALFSVFLEGTDLNYSDFSPKKTVTYSELPDGRYTLYVKAKDYAENLNPTAIAHTFVIDTTPPTVRIIEGPNGTIAHADVTFQFSASESVAFAFYLDRLESHYSRYTADTVTHYKDLPDGDYVLYVKARDDAGNETPRPVIRRFTIDTTSPGASFSLKPPAMTPRNTVAFAFTSNKPAQFSYYLDGKDNDFSPYTDTSEITYTGLPDGTYTFYLRSKDHLGNVDATPATVEFTVDTQPPQTTMIRRPVEVITYNTITFGLEANEAALFSTYLEGYDQQYSDYTSEPSRTYRYLPDGEYTFYARARDLAGNAEEVPVSHAFTVKTTQVIWQDDFETEEMTIKVGDFNAKNGLDFWGRSNRRVQSGKHSLWCAGQGGRKAEYNKNMSAWYEIEADLSPYSHATISLWYYMDTTKDVLDQFVLRAAPFSQAARTSYEGFEIIWKAPVLRAQQSKWVKVTIPLDRLIGQPTVLRLCFDSNDDVEGEGVYIDDIEVIGKY